jgi:hypothetical protein
MIPLPFKIAARISPAILLCIILAYKGNPCLASNLELVPLRLFYQGAAESGQACEIHGAPPSHPANKTGASRGGKPPSVFESEHRPVVERTYFFNEHRRHAIVKAYVRRPDGEVIEPKLQLGYNPNVSFVTPFGDGPIHGPNSVYIVEEGVDKSIRTIRTAKWITMHHNCGWGHNKKFDEDVTKPQPLSTIPFEIVVDKLWDNNFHLAVSSGDKVTVTVLTYGTPVAGAAVTLSTEKGWSKTVFSDKNGKAAFELIRDYYPSFWKDFKRDHRGEFLLTASYTDDKQGSFKGDRYQSTRFITTLPWLYTPSLRDYASYSHGFLLVLMTMTVSGLSVFIYRERRKRPYKRIQFDE